MIPAKKTATRSSLNNRGYEHSEHPRLTVDRGASTLKKSAPSPQKGDPFRVDAGAG